MANNDLSDSKCVKCKQNCSEDYFKCDSCLNGIHKECANLTSSEVRCMPLQKRVLLLICDECKVFIARMPHMIKLMEEMKRDIDAIRNEMKTSLSMRSYATVLQNSPETKGKLKSSLPTIVIKPKVTQRTQKSKKEIQDSIDPAKLNLGIKNLRETKQGNIVITCDSEQDIKLIKEEAERKLKENYKIELPKKILPRIKIAGYSGDESIVTLEKKIRKQNKWIDTADHLKITYIRRIKNKPNSTIYAECSGSLFNKMLTYGKVYIDWERLPVYEDLTVSRCYKCQGFHHKSPNCTKTEVCGNCAGSHSTLACERQIKKCVNCKIANGKHNLQLNTDHSAFDPECPSLKYQLGLLQNKTDYNS